MKNVAVALLILACGAWPHAATAQSKESAKLPASTEIDRANTGAIEKIGFVEKPVVLWKQNLGGDASFGGVAVFHGVVAVIERSRSRVVALDAASGERLWEHAAGPLNYGMGIVMTCEADFDAVIVGCDSGLVALDRETGKQLWRYETESGVDAPTIAAGLVIAGGSDGKVHAVDLKTGEEKWKHDYMADAPDDPDGFDGNQARFTGRAARPQAASTDGETVFLSIFDQCRTLAIDARTGKRRWTFQSKGWMRSQPTITADTVYVASQDRHFYALDKKTGKENWNVETGRWNSASAAITDRYVVFGSNDGKVYAIVRGMGSPAWEYDVTEGGKVRGSIYSRPLAAEGMVYIPVLSSGTIHAIDLTSGEAKWKLTPLPGAEIDSDPHFEDGRMFISTRVKSRQVGDAAVREGEAAIIAIGNRVEKRDRAE